MFGFRKRQKAQNDALFYAYLMEEAGEAALNHNFDEARLAIQSKTFKFKEDHVSRKDENNGLLAFSSIEEDHQNISFTIVYQTHGNKKSKPGVYMETGGPEYNGLKLSWLVADGPDDDPFIWVSIEKSRPLGTNAKALEAAFLSIPKFKNRDNYAKEMFGI